MEQLEEEGSWLPGGASGFGGGIGRTGLVCGAIAGAVISAGLRYGTGSPDSDRDKLCELGTSIVRSFEERFGSANCRALKEGVFVDKCAAYVEFCADEIAKTL
jgi:C_GCAxxG_C_C family probable redox protein